jgi:hypothetical protein
MQKEPTLRPDSIKSEIAKVALADRHRNFVFQRVIAITLVTGIEARANLSLLSNKRDASLMVEFLLWR